MKTRLITPSFLSAFRALFSNLFFAIENCQNSFIWGLPLVHSGLQKA